MAQTPERPIAKTSVFKSGGLGFKSPFSKVYANYQNRKGRGTNPKNKVSPTL
jgi:hypothetical protein